MSTLVLHQCNISLFCFIVQTDTLFFYIRTNCVFQLKDSSDIHKRLIFLLKKMDDSFNAGLHEVISCCRGKMKTGLLFQNFHQRISFCTYNF